MRNGNNSRRSPTGKLPVTPEEWRRMSLPAMLLGETMGEIMQASQFARTIVDAVSYKAGKPATDDPKTPLTERRKQKTDNTQNSSLQARRRREKQALRSESSSDMPSLRRAKSKINFKISPLKNNCDKENCRYIANRVSPRNKPWVKKTVLFPNPLFHSSPTSHNQKLCKTKSPVIARNRQTPHKFLIKSPNASKFQVKIKSPPVTVSPTRAAGLGKKSPPKANLSGAAKLRRSFSPSRLANRLVSPARVAGLGKKSPPKANLSAAAKLRRSFSPSRLANRLVSPLKSRKSVQRNEEDMKKMMSGLKQRPASFSIQFSPRRI